MAQNKGSYILRGTLERTYLPRTLKMGLLIPVSRQCDVYCLAFIGKSHLTSNFAERDNSTKSAKY